MQFTITGPIILLCGIASGEMLTFDQPANTVLSEVINYSQSSGGEFNTQLSLTMGGFNSEVALVTCAGNGSTRVVSTSNIMFMAKREKLPMLVQKGQTESFKSEANDLLVMVGKSHPMGNIERCMTAIKVADDTFPKLDAKLLLQVVLAVPAEYCSNLAVLITRVKETNGGRVVGERAVDKPTQDKIDTLFFAISSILASQTQSPPPSPTYASSLTRFATSVTYSGALNTSGDSIPRDRTTLAPSAPSIFNWGDGTLFK